MSEPTNVIDRFGDRWMNTVWRKPPADIAERTRRRVTMHLLPFLFFLYILAYLDRFNVSVAALKMKLSPEEHGLGFTDDIIGHGEVCFFGGTGFSNCPARSASRNGEPAGCLHEFWCCGASVRRYAD